MDLQEWTAGARCDADGIEFCHRCKPRALPELVFITGGGSAFHATGSCDLLRSGQQRVADRQGSPGTPSKVALQVAIGGGYLPCLGCFPAARGRS